MIERSVPFRIKGRVRQAPFSFRNALISAR